MPKVSMSVLVGIEPESPVFYQKTYEPVSDGVPEPILIDERTEPVVVL